MNDRSNLPAELAESSADIETLGRTVGVLRDTPAAGVPVALTPAEAVSRVSAQAESAPVLTGLTLAEAAGLVCVWCGIPTARTRVGRAVRVLAGRLGVGRFLTRKAYVPVGRSVPGSRVFVCGVECVGHVGIFRIFEREHGELFGPFRDNAKRAFERLGLPDMGAVIVRAFDDAA